MGFSQLISILTLFWSQIDSVCVYNKCPLKFKGMGVFNHTACLDSNATIYEAGVSEADKLLIVREHNKYRQSVVPFACDMLRLSWDDELAFVAGRWANNCEFDHDKLRMIPGKFSSGQSLAINFDNWKDAIAAWHDEVEKFTFAGPPGVLTQIGHYTSMVWSSSHLIGCAAARCNKYKSFYVCNYGPSGNLLTRLMRPYENCSTPTVLYDCPLCYNDAKLDVKTCKCTCPRKYPGLVGSDCHLVCDNATDIKQCADMDISHCIDYGDMPLACPWKCGVCPYADMKESNVAGGKPGSPAQKTTLALSTITCITFLHTIITYFFFDSPALRR